MLCSSDIAVLSISWKFKKKIKEVNISTFSVLEFDSKTTKMDEKLAEWQIILKCISTTIRCFLSIYMGQSAVSIEGSSYNSGICVRACVKCHFSL